MNQKINMQTIYIRMLEGVETFVPVNAKLIENNVFEIISNEDMDLEEDATCIYEFFPGDIVRCEMKYNCFLPVQKMEESFLLASELISSTLPNRKIYQLIFLIVKSLGEITPDQLIGFEEEIKWLCSNHQIAQKKHPVVINWLDKNCI